jgi:hypothetical protein
VDGNERPIDYGNPAGIMEFEIEPGVHTVRFTFEDTPPRQVGQGIALASLLLGLGVALLFGRRKARG